MAEFIMLIGLVGAPLLGAYAGWRVYCGTPWNVSEGSLSERVAVSIMVFCRIFTGWILVCQKLLDVIKP